MSKQTTNAAIMEMSCKDAANSAAWMRRKFVNGCMENVHFILTHDPKRQGVDHKGWNPDFHSFDYLATRSLAYICMGGSNPDKNTMNPLNAVRHLVGQIWANLDGAEHGFAIKNLLRAVTVHHIMTGSSSIYDALCQQDDFEMDEWMNEVDNEIMALDDEHDPVEDLMMAEAAWAAAEGQDVTVHDGYISFGSKVETDTFAASMEYLLNG